MQSVDLAPAGIDPWLSDERERVISWRAEQLERAGYPDGAVVVLATRTDIDVHLAVDLPAKGCPHDVALLILL
jgi:hypothetical protein